MFTWSISRTALLLAMAAGFAVIATFAVTIATGRDPGSAAKPGEDAPGWYVAVYRSAPGAATADPDCIARHIAFMNGLRDKGEVILAGRFTDADGGLAIFRFPDRETAVRTIMDDPIIRGDVLRADLHAWRPEPMAGRIELPTQRADDPARPRPRPRPRPDDCDAAGGSSMRRSHRLPRPRLPRLPLRTTAK
jgi:uncharacterized protein YciI